jgi:hypothetical protein
MPYAGGTRGGEGGGLFAFAGQELDFSWTSYFVWDCACTGGGEGGGRLNQLEMTEKYIREKCQSLHTILHD